MSWCPTDPPKNAESRLTRRDSAALYDSLDAIYLSPADGFDLLAPTYDQRLAGNPLLVLESTATLSLLPGLAGKSVADVGCGTGRYTLQLTRLGAATVIGVDISAEMLAIASRKAARQDLADAIVWQRGDLLERLPFSDQSIDVIVCALTLSFLPDASGAFRELCRILRPGGHLILSDYHPHGLAQARAESIQRDSNKSRAPYLRFTSASGEDSRIQQFVHSHSDLFRAGIESGLRMDQFIEPVPDRQISNRYPGLQSQAGIPLASVYRFEK